MRDGRKPTYAQPSADTRKYTDEEIAFNEARSRAIARSVVRKENEKKFSEKRHLISLDVRLILYEKAPIGWTPYVEDVRVQAGVRRERKELLESRAPIIEVVRGGTRTIDPRVLNEITDAAMGLEEGYTKERARELVSTYINAALSGASGRDAVEAKVSEWRGT